MFFEKSFSCGLKNGVKFSNFAWSNIVIFPLLAYSLYFGFLDKKSTQQLCPMYDVLLCLSLDGEMQKWHVIMRGAERSVQLH